jgi:hypothetical protein
MGDRVYGQLGTIFPIYRGIGIYGHGVCLHSPRGGVRGAWEAMHASHERRGRQPVRVCGAILCDVVACRLAEEGQRHPLQGPQGLDLSYADPPGNSRPSG